jgi:hypothetical protein
MVARFLALGRLYNHRRVERKINIYIMTKWIYGFILVCNIISGNGVRNHTSVRRKKHIFNTDGTVAVLFDTVYYCSPYLFTVLVLRHCAQVCSLYCCRFEPRE